MIGEMSPSSQTRARIVGLGRCSDIEINADLLVIHAITEFLAELYFLQQ